MWADRTDDAVFLRTRFWQNIKGQKLTLVCLVFILLLVLASTFSSYLTGYQPDVQGNLVTERYQKPSLQHYFGTDKFGRDLFSRVLYGGRISLSIALSVVFLALSIGLLYGMIAGYFGGMIDAVMMRFLDFWLAFPAIFLIMTVVALFRPDPLILIVLLSVTSWMETARLVRAEVLSLKSREFVLAAQGLGISNMQVLLRHIVPNSLNPIFVSAPLKVGEMILLESALSFLGIGVQPPMASWGSIINDGRDVLLQAWWVAAIPGIFIVLTVLSFNLVGEGLRNSMGIRK